MADNSETDMFDLSDDEFLNMSAPPEIPAEPAAGDVPDEPPAGDEPEGETSSEQPDIPSEKGDEDDTSEGEDNPLAADDEALDAAKPKEKDKTKAEEKPKDEGVSSGSNPEGEADKPAEPVDYEAAYKAIIGVPIKASGKTITLESPEEAISLIQKGADYTRRMQQLKPALKAMRMLENNDLLDEDKLSFLIDLSKKDQAAIAKFLSDSEIDPLDLDLESKADYKPGNHKVSDQQISFETVLEDVQSTPEGRETVQVIDKTWDRTSQGRVFAEPEILRLMTVHRSDGIYDQITSEMERRKILGKIAENTPFLDAYKAVGDELHNAGRLLVKGIPTKQILSQNPASSGNQDGNQQGQKAPARQERRVVDERPAQPKPAARNGAAVRAAAPTRTAPAKAASPDYNPLAMSDEDFEKEAGSFRL